jgi:tetratricopeptide (TPR) repeat protein/predicted Ser/Thr protein kinase
LGVASGPSQDDTLAAEGDTLTLVGEPAEPGMPGMDPRQLLTGQAGPLRLGHHVLLQVLGQGGMGVVYAAYDEKLDRKVAIKLLLHAREGAMLERRLAREAQAMARLSHPNVVQVYEIGEWQQLAFLVMEFVDGVTLRSWLAEPRSRADILATFLAAGRGLAAAHEQGLVHRDFKPDNVMIRRDGRVMVMDFGLARGDDSIDLGASPLGHSIDRASTLSMQITAAGALTGTPSYMAPEQYQARETDARTDQFSFCVALWEALYRERPFQGSNVAALALAVTDGKLVEPREHDVPIWLRRVLERGLARDAQARWPSMAALLAALERDPTRRRRALFAGVGVVALIGAAVIAVQVDRVHQREAAIMACEQEGRAITDDWNDEVAATLEQTFLATRASFAASTWSHTRPWLDDYARAWAELRVQTCREARVERTRSEESRMAISQCLDERRTTFVGLLDAWSHADRKLITRAPLAASGLSSISNCSIESLHREPPPEAIGEPVAELRVAIEQVRAMQLVGDYEAGLARASEILAEAEPLEWLPLLADAKLLVANLQSKSGRYKEARASAEAAFLDALRSGDESTMADAAETLTYVVGFQLGEHEHGRYWGEIGERLIARLDLVGTTREAGLLENIGLIQAERGRFAEAIDYQQRALAIKEAVLGPEHPEVASAHINLGHALAGKRDNVLAREHFERAVVIKQAVLGPEHPDVATAIHNIGVSLMIEGHYVDALDRFDRALLLREAALGPEHPHVAHTLGNIGFARNAAGETEGAARALRRALTILEVAYGTGHPQTIGVLNNLGLVYVSQGDDERALGQFRKALAISEATDPDSPDAAGSLINIADVLLDRGAWTEAREHYARALTCMDDTPDHPWIGLAKSGLGRVALELGELESAGELLELARLLEEQSHAEPLELAKTRFGLARLAEFGGDAAGARVHAEAAREHAVAAGKIGDRLVARIDAWLVVPSPDQSP